MKGVNPAWANLPRRACDDCGHKYKPKQPLREGQRGFCSDNCRKSYHKHGGAYRKLKGELRKLVKAEINELAEQVRKLMEPILDDAVSNIVHRELASIASRRSPNLQCPYCHGSGVYGEHGTGKPIRCHCDGHLQDALPQSTPSRASNRRPRV